MKEKRKRNKERKYKKRREEKSKRARNSAVKAGMNNFVIFRFTRVLRTSTVFQTRGWQYLETTVSQLEMRFYTNHIATLIP
uniref:Uncharacterized protein n=1 Tax=Romanomermis culicivorax TaxID=13658 RepID=A0A915HZI3_ROMCU